MARGKACVLLLLAYFLYQISFRSLFSALLVWNTHATEHNVKGGTNWLWCDGITYLGCLIFGYASDTRVKRVFILIIGYICQATGLAIGAVLLSQQPYPPTDGGPDWWWLIYYGFLTIVGIGASILKVSLLSYAADQLRQGPIINVVLFFHASFGCLNLANVLCLAPLHALYCNMYPKMMHLPFLIMLGFLFTSFLVFCVAATNAENFPAQAEILTDVHTVIREAFKIRTERKKGGLRKLEFFNNAKMAFGADGISGTCQSAKVDQVKDLLLSVILSAMLLPYWATVMHTDNLSMMNSTEVPRFGVRQTIDGTTNRTVESLILECVDTFVIILGILVMLPAYYMLSRQKRSFPLGIMFMAGMFLTSIAVLFSICGEYDNVHWGTCQIGNDAAYFVRDVLDGVGEVMVTVPGYTITYILSPRAYQGTVMGLFQSFAGLSALGLIALVNLHTITIHWILYGSLLVVSVAFLPVANFCRLTSRIILHF